MKKHPALRTWYGLVATAGGIGTHSRMPGTLGTIAACLILIILRGVPDWTLISVVIVGTIAAELYERQTGREDPGEVVIDEVAGYWVSMWGLGMEFAVVAFFLFRIVDIIKPFPVKNMEKLRGGIGIMADDICGGVIVNLLLRLLYWLFFAEGFTKLSAMLGIG